MEPDQSMPGTCCAAWPSQNRTGSSALIVGQLKARTCTRAAEGELGLPHHQVFVLADHGC